jgi:predicted DNA-binding protein
MPVTSIRLEVELKERLKALAGTGGYQKLVRDVLWRFVEGHQSRHITDADIRFTVDAIAQRDQTCALTGKRISTGQPMLLGLTEDGRIVVIARESVRE